MIRRPKQGYPDIAGYAADLETYGLGNLTYNTYCRPRQFQLLNWSAIMVERKLSEGGISNVGFRAWAPVIASSWLPREIRRER